MDTLGEGLDAFESEICTRPAVVNAHPEAAARRESHDGPPVLRVAIVGVPRWARQVRVVPAIALALWTAAGISVGAAHVLTLRVANHVPAPPPAPRVSRPAAAPTLVTVIVESVPEPPAKE